MDEQQDIASDAESLAAAEVNTEGLLTLEDNLYCSQQIKVDSGNDKIFCFCFVSV
jgi:hypothetical protein